MVGEWKGWRSAARKVVRDIVGKWEGRCLVLRS